MSALLFIAVLAADPSVESPDFAAWFELRAANANAGKPEIVRVPFVTRSLGWGCTCPMHYIGLSPDTGAGSAWLEPLHAPQSKLLEPGTLAVAEGMFTGKTRRFQGDDPDNPYVVYDFEVLRIRAFNGEAFGEETVDAQAHVILTGDDVKAQVAPLADGKPWAVITASLPLGDKTTKKTAASAVEKLRSAGFSAAESFDSRRAASLSCCYEVVVAGRFASEAEAKAALAKSKIKGAYVKRAF